MRALLRWLADGPSLTQRQFSAAFVPLFLLLTVALAVDGVLIARNTKAVKALCAQRDDLDLRIKAENELLAIYKGKLVFGIPRSLIQDGRDRDNVTRQNLELLDCKEAP